MATFKWIRNSWTFKNIVSGFVSVLFFNEDFDTCRTDFTFRKIALLAWIVSRKQNDEKIYKSEYSIIFVVL